MKSVMTEQTTASTLEKAGDHQLTRQFVEDRSEEAFRVIVSRYVNLVYSTGLRMVGDSHLADDVTQAVFIVFARKADSLKKKTVFASWFYRTTRFVAADLLRSENRRQDRERKAAEMNAINESANDPGWSDLAPELDRLMGRLGEKDRTAVVLRYFQQMESAEAAKVMGISEPALRKRLSRAVEKLRLLFKQRGIVAPAAALAAFLTADGAQAAPAVVIEGVAGSVTGGAATDAGLGLADAGLRSLKLAKLKLVAMWGASAAALAVVAAPAIDGALDRMPVGSDVFVYPGSADRSQPVGALHYLAASLAAGDSDAFLDGFVSVGSESNLTLLSLRSTGEELARLRTELASQIVGGLEQELKQPLKIWEETARRIETLKPTISGKLALLLMPDDGYSLPMRESDGVWRVAVGNPGGGGGVVAPGGGPVMGGVGADPALLVGEVRGVARAMQDRQSAIAAAGLGTGFPVVRWFRRKTGEAAASRTVYLNDSFADGDRARDEPGTANWIKTDWIDRMEVEEDAGGNWLGFTPSDEGRSTFLSGVVGVLGTGEGLRLGGNIGDSIRLSMEVEAREARPNTGVRIGLYSHGGTPVDIDAVSGRAIDGSGSVRDDPGYRVDLRAHGGPLRIRKEFGGSGSVGSGSDSCIFDDIVSERGPSLSDPVKLEFLLTREADGIRLEARINGETCGVAMDTPQQDNSRDAEGLVDEFHEVAVGFEKGVAGGVRIRNVRVETVQASAGRSLLAIGAGLSLMALAGVFVAAPLRYLVVL